MDAFDTHCAHTSTLRSWRSNDLRKLSYAAGDIIRVLATHDVGWWIGQCGDVVGLFRRRDTEPYEYPLRITRIHSYLHANSTFKCRTCAIRSSCGASPRCVVGDLNGSPKLQSFHTAASEPTRRVSLSLSLCLSVSLSLPLSLFLSFSLSLCLSFSPSVSLCLSLSV